MRNNFSLLILVLILAMSLVSSASAADENGITLIQPTGGTVSYTIKDMYIGGQSQYCIYLSNTPDDGYRFVRYIVKDTSGNDITLSTFGPDLVTGETSYYFVKQDATITAEFERSAYSITVTNPTGGTVTASPSSGSEGDTIKLSYTVSDGYLFRRFIVTKASDSSEVEVENGSNVEGIEAWYFNMPDGDVTVTAEISAAHAITVQNPEKGEINVHETGNVNASLSSAVTGDSVEVIVGASLGYKVKSYAVTKTGDSSVSVNTAFIQGGIGTDMIIFSFNMPDYPVTVSAQTESITYPITWNATNCTVNGPNEGHVGDTITFTVTPNDEYRINTITVNGDSTGVLKSENGGVYTYETTLTANAFLNNGCTVNVECSLIEYTITYSGIDGAVFTAGNPSKYTVATETFTLNNPTKTGYTFAGWTGTNLDTATQTVTIPKGSTGNRTYTAIFEKNLSYWGKTDSYNPDGTSNNPYKISTSEGWDLLVSELISGNSYSGSVFSLEADLTVKTMLGSNGTGFAGTFDGNGKKLIFNYINYSGMDNCAPFRYVNGGTIKDLTVEGTIDVNGNYAGGLIAQSDGATKIENCKFVGKLLTKRETIGGGFVAENNGTLTINGCLYAPAELEEDEDETEPSKEGTATFAHNGTQGTSTITNSYYTRTLGTAQGEQIYTVTADYDITIELAGDSENVLTHDGTIYAGSGKTLSLTISGGNTKDGYTFRGYKASAGTLTESGGKYSLTMPEGNVTISAEFVENISYIDADGQNATTSDYTVLTSSMTSLTAGTYVVKENVTLSALTLTGDVNLILCDGATLSVTGNVSGANSLVVYGQDSGTGTLTAANITLTDNKNLSVYGGNLTAGTISVAGTVTVKRATVNNETYDANGDSTTNYTVTFDSNGGSAIDSQTLKFKYGEIVKATKPADPTRDNYGFVEWQLNGTAYDFGTAVTGDMTLTAKWTATEYTITYNGTDEATFTTANPTKYTVETETFTLNNPTKNGSTFAGWTGTGLNQATMTVEIAKGSTGDREYTATWRKTGGKSQEDDPTKPTFAKHSLTLDGEIGVNFYMNLPQLEGVDYTDQDKCYMEFDVSGDQSNSWQYCNSKFKFANTNYYGFRCFVSSVQMADTIIATLHYGNNLTISQDYSVKEYTDAILENGSFSAEVNNLMIAIQDYGHFSQLMLSKANDWTIGKEFAEMPGSFTGTYSETSEIAQAKDGVKDFAIERDTGDSGVERVEMKLLLDSKTTINLYLHLKDSYTGEVSATLDNGTTNVAKKLSDKKYLVQIMNIPVHELGYFHTIKVTAGTEFNVRVAVLSYVHGVLNTEAESIGNVDITTMKNAVTALYRYYDAAMKYKASITD